MSDINGSVILVLGASGGLGSRLSNQLEARGATVVRSSRANGDTETVYGDLRDDDGPAGILGTAIERHGRIDGVIIAAGVVGFGPAGEVTDATIRELFEVNAIGPIRVIRDATPHLIESAKSGRSPFILTMSGIVSEMPTAGLAVYSAAKAALAAFTVAATRELRRGGIRIIDARPGHIETTLSEHPIAGTAPQLPRGINPDAVVDRMILAIVNDEKDLPSDAFPAANWVDTEASG